MRPYEKRYQKAEPVGVKYRRYTRSAVKQGGKYANELWEGVKTGLSPMKASMQQYGGAASQYFQNAAPLSSAISSASSVVYSSFRGFSPAQAALPSPQASASNSPPGSAGAITPPMYMSPSPLSSRPHGLDPVPIPVTPKSQKHKQYGSFAPTSPYLSYSGVKHEPSGYDIEEGPPPGEEGGPGTSPSSSMFEDQPYMDIEGNEEELQKLNEFYGEEKLGGYSRGLKNEPGIGPGPGKFSRAVGLATKRWGTKTAKAGLAAAAIGLASYGIYKAYKYAKRKRTSGASGAPGGPIPPIASALEAGTGQGSSSPAPISVPNAESSTTAAAQGGGGGGGGEPGPGGGTSTAEAALGGGGGGGENRPLVNAIDENWNAIAQEKAMGPDLNRTDPITPATGAKQTTDTANSVQGIKDLREGAEQKVAESGPESVHGNARERANMGKGAMDSWSFNGPYDYPVRPGGRPDETLTLMGAWKTRNQHDSSLWYSKKTARGADAKRNKYYKWSAKNGGGWKKLTKDEMVNVFQKLTRNEGGNFYGVGGGTRFQDLVERQLKNKDADIAAGKKGAANMEKKKNGFLQGQRKRKRGVPNGNTIDFSVQN